MSKSIRQIKLVKPAYKKHTTDKSQNNIALQSQITSSNSVESFRPVTVDYLPVNEIKYKIKLHNGLRSFTASNYFFTNKVHEMFASNVEFYKMQEIIRLDGKEVSDAQFPLDITGDQLIFEAGETKNDRYNNIFQFIRISVDRHLLKTEYKEKHKKQVCKTNKIRFYLKVDKKSNSINIVLADIHHIIADKNHEQIFSDLKDEMTLCIRDLIP